ncbi:hypothetical protein ABW21_db0202633 [Orbilia brochopaga]|nr:hypothetical protein ABW21_db0202633 [Drechslerella brochopaga]
MASMIARTAIVTFENTDLYPLPEENNRAVIAGANVDVLVIVNCCFAGLATVEPGLAGQTDGSSIKPSTGFAKELICAASWNSIAYHDTLAPALISALDTWFHETTTWSSDSLFSRLEDALRQKRCEYNKQTFNQLLGRKNIIDNRFKELSEWKKVANRELDRLENETKEWRVRLSKLDAEMMQRWEMSKEFATSIEQTRAINQPIHQKGRSSGRCWAAQPPQNPGPRNSIKLAETEL